MTLLDWKWHIINGVLIEENFGRVPTVHELKTTLNNLIHDRIKYAKENAATTTIETGGFRVTAYVDGDQISISASFVLTSCYVD
jgi:hypothetical protein